MFVPQCVVIGLQSTGEARTLEALEEGGGELNDFVSTAKYESRIGLWSNRADASLTRFVLQRRPAVPD